MKSTEFKFFHGWIVIGLLLTFDLAILLLSFRISLVLRNFLLPIDAKWELVWDIAKVALLVDVLVFSGFELYPGYGLTGPKELERTSKGLAVTFLVTSGIFYLNKPFQVFSRGVLLIAFGIAWWVLPVSRALLRNLLSRFSWYGVPVVLYGTSPGIEEIAKALRWNRRFGWRVVRMAGLEEVENPPADLSRWHIAGLVLSPEIEPALFVRHLSRHYRKVVVFHQQSYFGASWVQPRDLSGRLGLEFHYHLLSRTNLLLKRTIDLTVAITLLVLGAPFLLLIALLIKLDSPGPVLFRQERLGKDGRIFYALKFRTMVIDADAQLQELLARDPIARVEYEQFHKLQNDPRITRIGRWLRKFSLDELPQLINVLCGEMSLVGPRAYMVRELNDIGSYVKVILRIRPGLTGWWQVQGRHETTFETRLQMDEYYVSNWSLWMDLFILFKTIWAVVSGKGS